MSTSRFCGAVWTGSDSASGDACASAGIFGKAGATGPSAAAGIFGKAGGTPAAAAVSARCSPDFSSGFRADPTRGGSWPSVGTGGRIGVCRGITSDLGLVAAWRGRRRGCWRHLGCSFLAASRSANTAILVLKDGA